MRVDSDSYAEGYYALFCNGQEFDCRFYTQPSSNDGYDLEWILYDVMNYANDFGGSFALYRKIIDISSGKFVSLEKLIETPNFVFTDWR